MYESASIESGRLPSNLLFMTRTTRGPWVLPDGADDYKRPRRPHYASSAMMIAICAFCRHGVSGMNASDASVAGKDVEQNIDAALTTLHMDSGSDQTVKWSARASYLADISNDLDSGCTGSRHVPFGPVWWPSVIKSATRSCWPLPGATTRAACLPPQHC